MTLIDNLQEEAEEQEAGNDEWDSAYTAHLLRQVVAEIKRLQKRDDERTGSISEALAAEIERLQKENTALKITALGEQFVVDMAEAVTEAGGEVGDARL